jgi:hypothetical protein
MMALIASIAIGDGFNRVHHNWPCRCQLLSFVANAFSPNAHIAFTAALFTSLLN